MVMIAFMMFSGTVFAENMLLTCQVLNSSGKPIKTVTSGKHVYLGLNLDIPGMETEHVASFNVVAYAKKQGIKLPYKIDNFRLDMLAGNKGLELHATQRVKVPSILSGFTAQIQVTAKVDSYGSVKCVKTVVIK